MVSASELTEKITFQQQNDNGEWVDVLTTYAKITGLSNSQFYEQYAGGNADEVITVSVRYKAALMELIPQTTRIVHGSNVYDVISPPDNVLFTNVEIKFRARRQIS